MLNPSDPGAMNGPSMRPPGKPDNVSVQPLLPPQNGAAGPQRTLHPPPALYPISQMQEMYNAASQYQYAPPVAHLHSAAHLSSMAPPPAHLLGSGMGPIQAMHAMTVPPTHFQLPTQPPHNVSVPNEMQKPESTNPVPDLAASSSEMRESNNLTAEQQKQEVKPTDISEETLKPVENSSDPEVAKAEPVIGAISEVKAEENSEVAKQSEPVPQPEQSVDNSASLSSADSTTEQISQEKQEPEAPKQEEATSTSSDPLSEPSSIVATKSVPPPSETPSAGVAALEENKEPTSEPVKEPEAIPETTKTPTKVTIKPLSPKKPQTKTKAEKKSEIPAQPKPSPKKTEKTSSPAKESPKTESPAKRKRDESARRAEEKADASSGDDRKSKRARTQTMPFQAALEDLTYLRMVKKLSQPPKAPEEKVVIFLKNEFLAVRNPEGSFYVCRALQDVIRNSHNIKICWMTNEKQSDKDLYGKDYNDKTDFECILTNLAMEKVDKDTFRLPVEEKQRTDNILKRALDKEKGVLETSITEDNPDGIDVSLIKDGTEVRRRTRSTGPNSASDEEGGESSSDDGETPPPTPRKKTPSKRVQKTPAKTPAKTPVKPVAATPKASAAKSKRGAVTEKAEESGSKGSSSEGRRSSKRARPSAVELPPLTDDEFEELLGDSPDENDSDSEGEKKKKKKKSKKKKSKEEKAAKKAEKKQKKEKGSSKSEDKDEEATVAEGEPPAKKAKETKKSKKSKK